MKKRIFALALALCMMLSVMPTSFAGNGFLTDDSKAAPQSGVLTDDSKAVSQSGVLTGASKYYRQDGILYNTGSQSGASYSLPSGTLTSGNTTTFDLSSGNSGGQTSRAAIPGYDTLDKGGVGTAVQELENTELKGNTATAGAANPDTTVKVANDKVTLTKNVVDSGNGTYTINLGASTESETITVKSARNIVLVLDASQSMVSDADKLEGAVKNFLTSVTESPDSKVAIISYSDEAKIRTSNSDSTAFVPIVVESAGTNVLNPALTAATTAVANATKATNGTSNVAKLADRGMEKAVDVIHGYNAIHPTDNVPVIVVLFTNGVPTKDTSVKWYRIWDETYDAYGIAQDTLHWSTILKGDKGVAALEDTDTYRKQAFYASWSITDDDTWARMQSKNVGCGATVYTVGINLPTDYQYILDYHVRGCNCCKVNEFMYRASSHVKTSAHTDSGYTDGYYDNSTRNHGYYLVGEMTSDLFDDIQVEGGVSLDNVTLKDVLPDYLEVVDKIDGTVSVENGKTVIKWTGKSVKPGISGALNKSFTVRFKDGFLGGHSVPTNEVASGLYAVETSGAESLVGNFGIPTVNVKVPDITVTATNKNIYLSQDLSAKALMYGVKATIVGTGSMIDPSMPNFGLESWQTAYTKSIAFTTAAKNGLTDDTTFTVTCTVIPNDAETTIYQPKTASGNANITVFKPKITFNDTTVYLGTKADYSDNHNDNCVSWVDSNDNTASNMTGIRPSVAVRYDRSADIFEDCTPVKVTEVKLGSSTTDYQSYATFQNDDAQSDGAQFTVHVLTPTVSMSDQVIYLSQSVQNTEATVTWKAKCEHNKSTTTGKPDDAQVKAVFRQKAVGGDFYTEVSPESCEEYTAYVTISNTVFTSFNCDFKVHVLVPTVSATGFSIHLGTSVDLKTVAGVSENWACADNITEATGNRTAPTVGYDFYIGVTKLDAVNAYAPDDDVPAVTAVLKIGTNDYNKQYSKEFAIDVIMPQFTVNQKEVWADYTADVNLDDHYGHTLKEVKWDKATYTLVTKEPSVVCTFEYKVNEGNGEWTTANQVYKQGTQDTLISVTKATWAYATGKTYVATVANGKLTVSDGFDFKIHVNKFDLTINKTWNGADVYKQDAIFTVSGSLGEFQVVLPAGQESITVKNLLCGQDYTVAEDSNWTWRWKANVDADGKEHVTVNGKTCSAHRDNDNKPIVATSVPSHQEVEAEFNNSLINRLWFSFCTFVKNIFGAGRFEGRGN